MRADSIGMFWQDEPTSNKRGEVLRAQPPIPDTGWTTPKEFPNLSAAKVLSIDTETKDPNLLTRGPGWARNDGHLIGLSVATDDGGQWYFPFRHEIEPEHNLDPANVLLWASDMLGDARQPKVGANLMYDVGWLQQEGVRVKGDLYDVQFAEALLDESARTNLDALATKYLGQTKETSDLYQWCADYFGGAPNGRQRANMYRTPPRLAGPYAEADARLPLQVLQQQAPLLRAQGLYDLFLIECELIPLLIAMRFRGVRVDVDKAEQLSAELLVRSDQLTQQLAGVVGFNVNVNSAAELSQAFDVLKIKYNRTAPTERNPDGQPSFTQAYLDSVEHPAAEIIREIRKCDKLRGTFIESYILNNHVNGRVHAQFHPLRGDTNGTRSGRFSSSDPNLQNIPSRDPELAPKVRGLFLPEEGCLWHRKDYSQIEYRGLVHYAVGPGAEEARQRYVRDPSTDYHQYVMDMVFSLTGFQLARKPAKSVNFGLVYGMQKPKLTKTLGLDRAGGLQLFDAYHEGVPFVQSTMDATAAEAQELGYITTLLGRRSRFDLWEASKWTGGARSIALPYERAVREYGMVKRAQLHKALNRRLQGTAADLMKVAMVLAWRQGVFDVLGVPHVTVHDELGMSEDNDPAKKEAWRHLDYLLENCLPFNVPIKIDTERGPDWGHVG